MKKAWLIISALLTFTCHAGDADFQLVLKDHLFFPAEIHVPANKKVRLVIDNQDATPEEFDSFDLNREKVLFPGRKSVIYIGPLEPGRYHFFGEFSPNSARGVVIAGEDNHADK